MRKRDRSPISNAVALLVCGVLAGVVVAAAAFPAVAMSGLAAKAGADGFDSLPTELTVQQSPQISYVYAADGKTLISTFYDENRRDVPASDIAPVMLQAMVAAEDMRFYEHHGVDVKGVIRAFVANQQAGGTSQGASTLTMQYVRQAIEYSATTPQQVVDATSDTPGRKLREMRYALALEKQLTKQQILERYLNLAPFGENAYGIYAAAQVYFGKTPKELTLPEAALLAGLVKAPSAFDPATDEGRPQALDRRTYVLDNMVKMNDITQAQADAAKAAPLTLAEKHTPNGCTSVVDNSWGFFCDYFYRWWLQQPAFGADQYERAERLMTGGYKIYTTLDVAAQAAAVKNINSQAKQLKPSDALMLAGVEPGTGHIEVMAVNRTYSNDQTSNGPSTNPQKKGQKGNYPRTTVPLLGSIGENTGGYQFGSTFKMFTMLAALQAGLPLATTINTTNPYRSSYPVDRSSKAACPGTSFYCPSNASKSEAGPYNMWTGFGSSVNTFFVPLEEQVGASKAVDMAKNLGITFNGDPKAQGTDAYLAANSSQWGAFTLGVSAATPLEMANAYATVAADGVYCEPLPVIQIQDYSGAKLDAGNPRCRQAVDPDVARAAADAARCPVGDQSFYGECHGATASPTRDIVPHAFQIAGKTGTTDDDRTAALIAMTKQLAIAGITADPDNSDTHGYSHSQVNYAVQHTLADAMAGRTPTPFTKESDKLAYGQRVPIPNVKCQPPDQAQNALKAAGFTPVLNPNPAASDCPAGTVAGTTPSGTTTKGGVVTVTLSSGPAPGSPPATTPSTGPGQGGGGPVDCRKHPAQCLPGGGGL
jgi:membrane peptidoglycan carboxypeptidase